jgi:hypothetical protein
MYLDKIQGNKLIGFIKPVLDLIDNGVIYRKGFWVLYLLHAVASLLIPLFLLAFAIAIDIFKYQSFGIAFCLVLMWLSIAFSCWLGFQVFWNRMEKIDALFKKDCDFVAIPLIADYIKTAGEFIGVVAVSSVPCFILLGIVASDIAKSAIPNINTGVTVVFTPIFVAIWGYLIMLVAKFCAESITAFASIANNTKNLTKSTYE